MNRRARNFLAAMALIPTIGISIVVLRPPPNYGYLPEQVCFLAFALMALLTVRINEDNVAGAVFYYCSLALLPVLSMLARHHTTIDDAWALAYVVVPFFGLGFVTLLTKSGRAILAYGAIAFLFAVAVGAIYDKPGLAGVLCALSAMATSGALVALDCSRMKMRAELDRVRESTGELGADIHRLDQKIGATTHDPR